MLSLLEMSVTGGILAAVAVIIRAVAVNRLPKKVFLAFWAAVLCCLFFPFRIPSPVSVYAAVPSDAIRRPGVLLGNAATAPAQDARQLPIALLVWAGVALLLALAILIAHLRARTRYRASLPVEHPFVKAWTEAHRLRRPVQVRYSDQIDAPLTYGLLWPVVLLPKSLDWADEDRLAFILAHEYAHIRRFDALWKWVLALCIHWFNPLVWVTYVLANRDLELSCDESVVRMYGSGARAPYALTLVGMEEHRAHFTPLASSFAKNALEERITAIMKLKKTTIAASAVALALVAVVITVFATSAPAGRQAAAPLPSPTASAAAPSPSAAPAPSRTPGLPNVNVLENGWDWDPDDYPSSYTQEQYDLVIRSLKFEGYEKMSIAEFNRKLNAALYDYAGEDKDGVDKIEKLNYAYEMVLSYLPEDDPNAGFLLNTVQASREEYSTRLNEVYTGKRVDPTFSGRASCFREEDVFGDKIRTEYAQAEYEFTYRILDQDKLTVAARDQFLQDVLSGAQAYLDAKTPGQIIDDPDGEASFTAALEAAGKAASNANIEFTGCEVRYYDDYR